MGIIFKPTSPLFNTGNQRDIRNKDSASISGPGRAVRPLPVPIRCDTSNLMQKKKDYLRFLGTWV